MKIAVIDTEGIQVGLGGSKQYKESTCWISDVALVVYDTKIGTITRSLKHKIRMPVSYREVDEKTREIWTYSQRFAKKMWDSRYGLSYEESMDIIGGILDDCDEIWAKGKIMENRFLNNLGMYGKSFCYKARTPADHKFFVNEMNGIVTRAVEIAGICRCRLGWKLKSIG